MAWNKQSTKALDPYQTRAPVDLGPGLPVSINPGTTGRPYRDGWSIERAYREGMQKVTWVFRCIDVIASNQARLPVILREDNFFNGEILKKDNDVTTVLNSRANIGENAFSFRYRVSSQLLMSTRGVFIEKVYARNGDLLALNLLPPQSTAPIPHPTKFVSGFQVDMPNGERIVLPPERVLWIRKPHPLDPYLSLTPMESAGIAIEIENLAKQYNRNYLLNDGRPGMLLVARGEVDPDDRSELEARFSGGGGRNAGRTTVIGSDDGIDVLDLSASPRDAAYSQMRDITKDEILAAFGVPEPAIGNSSGRTFSNASEEMRGFWLETMLPHLNMLGRGFDELDEKYYVDFDTSGVPVLILLKQEKDRFLMDEWEKGLRSANEYRGATGQKLVESDLADSLLANPNLTPIANTEKPFEPAPIEEPLPEAIPGEEVLPPEEPAPPIEEPAAPAPIIEASALNEDIITKALRVIEQSEYDKWENRLEEVFEGYFKAQYEELASHAGTGESLAAAFDMEKWDVRLNRDVRPVVKAIIEAGAESVNRQQFAPPPPQNPEAAVDEQMDRVEKINEATLKALLLLAARPNDEEDDESHKAAILAALTVLFLHHRHKKAAEHEAIAAWNSGVYHATAALGPTAQKTWVSQNDEAVRTAHRELDGQTQPVTEPFRLADGTSIRFPGDPLCPPHMTIGCRCKLRFGGF